MHLKVSSPHVSNVFRVESTSVLLDLLRVFSQSMTFFGSMNGKTGVAVATTVGGGVVVGVLVGVGPVGVGPVGTTVNVGWGVWVGKGVRVLVGVGLGVG